MTGIDIFYCVSFALALILIVLNDWWDFKHEKDWELTLIGVFTRTIMIITPVLNSGVVIALAIRTLGDIAPSIVLFGKKKK